METQLQRRYTTQGLVHAVNIFNFPQDYSKNPTKRTLAFRYLFQHRGKLPRICPSESQIVSQMLEMFNEVILKRLDNQHLYELADILSTYAPDHGDLLLNRIRELQERNVTSAVPLDHRRAPPEQYKPIKKTVYADSQNVHNTKINKSVLHATKTLYGMYSTFIEAAGDRLILNIRGILCAKYPQHSKLITDSIKYIQQSVATFRIDIGLLDTFCALWMWIHDQKQHVDELEQRLLEELKEMHGQCSTGHLARLINVIQGYTDDERLCIRITNEEQINAVIRSYLTKCLAECEDDKVLDGMTDGGEEYVSFIRNSVAKRLLEWKRDYGDDFLGKIAITVNRFAGVTVFTN